MSFEIIIFNIKKYQVHHRIINLFDLQFRWYYANENVGDAYDTAVQYEGLRESLISIAVAEKEHGKRHTILTLKMGFMFQEILSWMSVLCSTIDLNCFYHYNCYYVYDYLLVTNG